MEDRQEKLDRRQEQPEEPQPEFEREFIVKNPRGLHSRPGGDLVKLAASLPCEVYFSKNGKTVNGKSMIGVLSLGAKFGDKVTVKTRGSNALEALNRLGALIDSVME